MEVVVVGGGIAGLCAARRAQQVGARVTIADKAVAAPGSNSRLANGAYHAAHVDAHTEPSEIVARTLRATSGTADLELTETWARRVAPALAWLQAEGIEFVHSGALQHQRWAFSPPRPSECGPYFPGRGGDAGVERLKARFLDSGGVYLSGATATKLITEGGDVTGVVVQTADGPRSLFADATVLCDGGFQANREMVHQYISTAPELMKLRGASTGTGDALCMAVELGADIVNMGHFYGHLLSRDCAHNEMLSPFPHLDVLMKAGMLVDADGLRFLDEGQGGVTAANVVAKRADPRGQWVICDKTAWETVGTGGSIVPPNPHLVEGGGTLRWAASIAELASELGVDSQGLIGTVADFNQAALAGGGESLSAPRSGGIRPLTPPFGGMPTIAGITYTLGGLRINSSAQVLDKSGRPIPGLLAAGGTAGGIEGGPRAGYVGGLSQAVVFGLIAGESSTKIATDASQLGK